MNKERRLGRGLEALLGRPLGSEEMVDAAHMADDDGQGGHDGLLHLHVYDIENNPFQPRIDFDDAAIGELAASLQTHGMIQPLVVRRHGERFQLISGERRLRAAIKAGWEKVPVQLREADDRQMSEVAIVENLQRKDLNALEKAHSFHEYLERYGCTQEELAGRLNIDRSTIANLIRLLELPEAIQVDLCAGNLTQGHARALLPLGDEREQLEFARRIQEEGLSVRATEELVQQTIHQADHEPLAVVGGEAPARGRAPRRSREHSAALEQELRSALGTKVDIKQRAAGRGQIVVHFTSPEEFERLREHLCAGVHIKAG
ncbi:MAG: ParB/RepB/Spo0J family partition protein [Planctomycetota bacterium]|nr:MAG: ParB/RepB/Spo0J family partition protein [Planctomycetota bacterium]